MGEHDDDSRRIPAATTLATLTDARTRTFPAYRAAVDALDPQAALDHGGALIREMHAVDAGKRDLAARVAAAGSAAPLADLAANARLLVEVPALEIELALHVGPQELDGTPVLGGLTMPRLGARAVDQLAVETELTVALLAVVDHVRELVEAQPVPLAPELGAAIAQIIEPWRSRPVSFAFIARALRKVGLWERVSTGMGAKHTLAETEQINIVQVGETGRLADVGTLDAETLREATTRRPAAIDGYLVYDIDQVAPLGKDQLQDIIDGLFSAGPTARGPLLRQLRRMGKLDEVFAHLPYAAVQQLHDRVAPMDPEAAAWLDGYFVGKGGGRSMRQIYRDEIDELRKEGEELPAWRMLVDGHDPRILADGLECLAFVHNIVTAGGVDEISALQEAHDQGLISDDDYSSGVTSTAVRTVAVSVAADFTGGVTGELGVGFAEGLGAGKEAAQLAGGATGGFGAGVGGNLTADVYDQTFNGKSGFDSPLDYLKAGAFGAAEGTAFATAGLAATRKPPVEPAGPLTGMDRIRMASRAAGRTGGRALRAGAARVRMTVGQLRDLLASKLATPRGPAARPELLALPSGIELEVTTETGGDGAVTVTDAELAKQADPAMEAWTASQEQAKALQSAKEGTPTADQRTRLANELRRQVPDIELVDAVRAGTGETVVSVVSPGGGDTGIKTMNDKLIGYDLNSRVLNPARNKLIKSAFEAEGLRVVDQGYKATTLVSAEPAAALAEKIQRALRAVDAGMKPILESALRQGISEWTEQAATLEPGHPDAAGAQKRIAAMRSLLADIEGAPSFRFEIQVGAAPLEGGPTASYGEVLAAEMNATKAALMARDASIPRHGAGGDTRAMVYSKDEFLAVARETAAIKELLQGKNLPYHGERSAVLEPNGTMNRDILRAMRKGQYHEALSADDRATLELADNYFKRVNTFDYIKHFTADELGLQAEQVAKVSKLVDALEADGPVTRDLVDQIENVLKGEVPQAGAASEAQFFNRAAGLKNRVVINADIKDLGLTLFDGYAETMGTVASGDGADLAMHSQSASDRVVRYKREAARAVSSFYTDQLIPEARRVAIARQRADLLPLIDQESTPLMLLGGDEITVSLHSLFEELDLVKPLADKLTDPEVANARVAVTRSSTALSGAEGHAEAMAASQTGHDLLKSTCEPLARELNERAKTLPPPRNAAAKRLAKILERVYIVEGAEGPVFYAENGEPVDIEKLTKNANELLQPQGNVHD